MAASAIPPLPSARNRRAYAVALGAVGVLLVLPILIVPFPPLVDYPNHLAEGYILAQIDDAPILQSNYETILAPFPNLGATLILYGLMGALPPLAAGKALLVILMGLWVLGAHMIGRSLTGRSSWLAVPVALVAYNSSLYYGFLNYSVSLPLFLITFAAWLRWRSALGFGRLLALVALVCLCYLSHLSAYVFLGIGCVMTLAIDLAAHRRLRSADFLSLLPLLPPAALFVAYMGGSGEVGGVEWGNLTEKSLAFLSPFIAYDRRVDVAVLLLIAASALVAVRWARPSVRRGALACGVAYAAAIFATPRLIFTSSGADIRYAIPALVCLLFAADFRLPTRAGRISYALLVIALCLKLFGVWGAWAHQSREIACSVRALEHAEAGARIFPLYLRSPDRAEDKRQRGLIHVAHYATLLRQAYVPSLFTYTSQQLVQMRRASPAAATILPEMADPGGLDWSAIRKEYDYIWGCRLTPAFQAQVASVADETSACLRCGLWRIRPETPAP
jgi:hypothetical protein